jgi:hypothetical protein
LIFDVFYPDYYIGGIKYSAGSGSVTLDTADPSNPRLDVIGVNSSGAIKITGTAAADPVKPTVDPTSQLEITVILVGAGATTPSITEQIIYAENVEWTGSSDNGTVSFSNTTTPFQGTKCTDVGSFSNGQYIRFVDSTTNSVADYTIIRFYLNLKATFANTTYLRLRLKNGSTVISSTVSITSGQYNFVRTTINAYQLITVPLSAFSFTGSTFNTVEFLFFGSNTSGFKLDYVSLQTGTGTTLQKSIVAVITDSGIVNSTTAEDSISIVGAGGASTSAFGKTVTITQKNQVQPYTNLAGFPVTGVTGVIYIAQDTNYQYRWTGSAYVQIGGGGGGGTPGGTTTQVQFNDSGAFAGDSGFTYDKTNNIVGLESIDWAQTPTAVDAVRRMLWDDGEGSLALTLKGGNVTVTLGTEVASLVYNAEATTLDKGTVVYVFGASGQRVSVKKAVNTGDSTSAQTFGVVAESIASGAEGWVIVQGMVRGLDTSAYTQGDALYLSATAGQFTKTKPYAPNHLVYVGFVVKINASSGEIFVKCQNGYELHEIHDLQITSVADKNMLMYDGGTSLWKNNVSLSTDTALSSGSDSLIPSQKAVKTYVDAGANASSVGGRLYLFNAY